MSCEWKQIKWKHVYIIYHIISIILSSPLLLYIRCCFLCSAPLNSFKHFSTGFHVFTCWSILCLVWLHSIIQSLWVPLSKPMARLHIQSRCTWKFQPGQHFWVWNLLTSYIANLSTGDVLLPFQLKTFPLTTFPPCPLGQHTPSHPNTNSISHLACLFFTFDIYHC